MQFTFLCTYTRTKWNQLPYPPLYSDKGRRCHDSSFTVHLFVKYIRWKHVRFSISLLNLHLSTPNNWENIFPSKNPTLCNERTLQNETSIVSLSSTTFVFWESELAADSTLSHCSYKPYIKNKKKRKRVSHLFGVTSNPTIRAESVSRSLWYMTLKLKWLLMKYFSSLLCKRNKCLR